MKINPNYLGRLFTEQELSPEETTTGGEAAKHEKREGETLLSTM